MNETSIDFHQYRKREGDLPESEWWGQRKLEPTDEELIAHIEYLLKTPKEKMKVLKADLEVIIEDRRRNQKSLRFAPNKDVWAYEMIAESIEERVKICEKNISMLEFDMSPGSAKHTLNIAKAKEFPITNMVEFNRAHKALCLWHTDSNPSMHYYKRNNMVYCFVCNQSGDAIDVAQKMYGLEFAAAVKKLTNNGP
jgi:DNA primase